MSEDWAGLAAATPAVYERQAARFDAERSKSLFEEVWLERFVARLRAGGRILDLGCGAGDPFPAWFAERGFSVTGVDQSQAMLALARARHPEGDWREADMRRLALGETFDGIIGWHSFFHLTPDEQRAALPRLAGHLAPGGVLLLTVGPEAGEVDGYVGGERVYHSSLALPEYAAILDAAGLSIIAFIADDPDCDQNSVLMARRAG